jgi:hypothetical protein
MGGFPSPGTEGREGFCARQGDRKMERRNVNQQILEFTGTSSVRLSKKSDARKLYVVEKENQSPRAGIG